LYRIGNGLQHTRANQHTIGMLTGANFRRNHGETLLAFGASKKENHSLAKAFGVDKAGFHPV
jgi:hypothetical protein